MPSRSSFRPDHRGGRPDVDVIAPAVPAEDRLLLGLGREARPALVAEPLIVPLPLFVRLDASRRGIADAPAQNQTIEALLWDRAHEGSAWALAFRAWTGYATRARTVPRKVSGTLARLGTAARRCTPRTPCPRGDWGGVDGRVSGRRGRLVPAWSWPLRGPSIMRHQAPPPVLQRRCSRRTVARAASTVKPWVDAVHSAEPE